MTTSLPTAPAELSTRSKALWKKVVAAFALEPADLELFRCGLVALDRADQAAAEIGEHGLTMPDRYGGRKTNPATDIEARNRALYAKVVAQLGIKSMPEEVWNPTRRKAQAAANARWANR